MKKIIIICVILLFIGVAWYYIRHPLETRIQIGHTIFTVELAITAAEKEKGLGYRDNLGKNHGMLFPYDHPEKYSFWMKGMRFPIDILWIRDSKIVDISKNVPVATTSVLPVYSPREPVNQVLELGAGTSDQEGIKTGDTLQVLK
jgi:uncharacterized membrane protein (UPF0127 family)